MSAAPLPPPREPAMLELQRPRDGAAATELAAGLLSRPVASVAPKYLYDRLGSRLFEAITELPEYYPTRTEAAIFAAHGAAIAQAAGPGRTLVDLGAGNCEKASALFPLLRPRRYVAVDISAEFLAASLHCLQRQHPEVVMTGIAMDFSAGLSLPPLVGAGPRVVFYPGSSIGNFEPQAAARFLADVRRECDGGALLIGVDLDKAAARLEPAYDDPLGVTAAFNRNLLLNVNRLLGSDFRLADWRHVARYDSAHRRIEMHLEARRALEVRWPGAARPFVAGERILTEHSYKYRLEDFEAMLRDAGFSGIHRWTDAERAFAVFVAAA